MVLDADSLIEAETILELTRRMEADPDAGIIQTVPWLINGRSGLARLQQVRQPRLRAGAGERGLLGGARQRATTGATTPSSGAAPSRKAAGLPVLSGPPPFGGHILSHDFVEAALIRRAGYSVRIADDLGGSYEEGPSSIIDLATRDRRWCQGNLQHARIVLARGLNWVSRFHLLNGIALLRHLAALVPDDRGRPRARCKCSSFARNILWTPDRATLYCRRSIPTARWAFWR